MTQESPWGGAAPMTPSQTVSEPWARPSRHRTMLDLAQVLSRRATCPKLSVGCVLTDIKGRIVGTGYNGVPQGLPHCTDCDCGGAKAPPGSDTCIAVHAEQNAIMRCTDVDVVHAVYVTHAPCLRCTKMLLNTGAQNIYYSCEEISEPNAQTLWQNTRGRVWIHYPYDENWS
ncbi:MAG: hypothetical protein E6Q97_18045 [Desulfurellales bacterium]|nr:MAG: hypothetical protein E6Q97_18045 [Desulfurellales bacterium]